MLDGRPISRSFNIGTMSTHTVVRREAVVKIPFEMPFTSACIMGCGVMTGYGSAVNAAKVEPGSSVVVIGCGGVGLNVIQGARIAGAVTIIAVDLTEARLDMSRKFGATHLIQASADDRNLMDAASRVKALTEGRGADYAFESTANPALGAAPLAMIRHGGTAVQVSGIEQDLTIDMNLFEWDKTYINPLYGKCCPEQDFPRLFALYRQGKLLLDELVTRTYRMDQLADAFADMHAGVNAKGVIVMD
jgi:S-(hydroxymethyl)glutathione dehydrogenase/alcohol dehydrogenase